MKFEWSGSGSNFKVHVHQEAFMSELISCHQLSDCNRPPRATPFKSGFPVNAIPPSALSDADHSTFTLPYQQFMGDLTWLGISTQPDITAILLLLSEHAHAPSNAHLNYALYVVQYLASIVSLGLIYSFTAKTL